jgi:hypothetical protein
MKLATITMVRNEEKIIPYFIHHYHKIVDMIAIIDHSSTDKTVEVARETASKLGVPIHIEIMPNNGYDDTLLKTVKENMYKGATNLDAVIVADADEFWHHKEGTRDIIEWYWKTHGGLFVIKPEGYQMVHDLFPAYSGTPMIELVKKGSPDSGFDKPLCFTTNLHLHGMMGMHVAYHYTDKGQVVAPIIGSGMKLLHYKFLGLEHRIERVKNSANNLSQHGKDLLAKGIAIQFECNEENLTNEFKHWQEKAKDVDI